MAEAGERRMSGAVDGAAPAGHRVAANSEDCSETAPRPRIPQSRGCSFFRPIPPSGKIDSSALHDGLSSCSGVRSWGGLTQPKGWPLGPPCPVLHGETARDFPGEGRGRQRADSDRARSLSDALPPKEIVSSAAVLRRLTLSGSCAITISLANTCPVQVGSVSRIVTIPLAR